MVVGNPDAQVTIYLPPRLNVSIHDLIASKFALEPELHNVAYAVPVTLHNSRLNFSAYFHSVNQPDRAALITVSISSGYIFGDDVCFSSVKKAVTDFSLFINKPLQFTPDNKLYYTNKI